MKRRIRRILLYFCVGIVAIALPVAYASDLVRNRSASEVCDVVDELPHKRVGLVLGCSPSRRNGTPNLFFAHRIAAAAELFNARKVDYLLVSGDNRTVYYDEPTAMKNALIAKGVPENRIVLDYAGLRTLDSVVRAKKVFGLSELCIITQRDHALRALYIAKEHGIDAVGFAAEDVHSTRGGLRTKLRESIARVFMLIDVHVLDREPRFLGPTIEIGS